MILILRVDISVPVGLKLQAGLTFGTSLLFSPRYLLFDN